jgi:SAM-dependent methyltransferase
MYKRLKSLIKSILPRDFLVRNEQWIRGLAYPLYLGNRFECLICGAQLSRFIKLESGDLLCPRCGSLPRTRRLWRLIEPQLKAGLQILHFSPSRVLFRKLKKRRDLNYLSTDFEDEFLADQKLDIRHTGLPDQHFDLIICYHVLEHIDDDRSAMQELYRILKLGGQILIQTPFKPGEIFEDQNIVSPEDRLKHFGQADHVRVYSVEGLRNRLEDIGFVVEVLSFEEQSPERLGLKSAERVLRATKE